MLKQDYHCYMNANTIINDGMTLEEKLAAIDAAMATVRLNYKQAHPDAAPLDPSDLTTCEGCQ
jgi:hypothetical protein